ncbi:MAG: SDR family oxidoreductase [Verrucomicrobiota bacterium]
MKYEEVKGELKVSPKTWLITGVSGFIGSHLLEALLNLGQRVIGLDNFSTGREKNLQEVAASIGPERWKKFQFINGDIRSLAECRCACHEVDFVLHHAALGSVPLSILDPITTHESNVTGFVNMLVAARDARVKRFVYASSSAIYGDDPYLPKVEEKIGQPLSPYAASKRMDEIYAEVFSLAYKFQSVGLRYFNVFGPRQDPEGAYAAVIPKWISALLKRQQVVINGDGETSRDFCFVENVVQANLLAATTTNPDAVNQAYNIAVGEATTLNELFSLLQSSLRKRDAAMPDQKPVYQDFRAGDVRHSLADISKAKHLLHYETTYCVRDGLEMALDWYKQNVV